MAAVFQTTPLTHSPIIECLEDEEASSLEDEKIPGVVITFVDNPSDNTSLLENVDSVATNRLAFPILRPTNHRLTLQFGVLMSSAPK